MATYIKSLENVYNYLVEKGHEKIWKLDPDENNRIIELTLYVDKNIDLTNYEERILYKSLWEFKRDIVGFSKLCFINTTIKKRKISEDNYSPLYPVPLIHNLIYSDINFEVVPKLDYAPIYDISFSNSSMGVLYHLDKLTDNKIKENGESGIKINLMGELDSIEYFNQEKPFVISSTEADIDKSVSYFDIRHKDKMLMLKHPESFDIKKSSYTVYLQNKIESDKFFNAWSPIPKIMEKYSNDVKPPDPLSNLYSLRPFLKTHFYKIYDETQPENIEDLKIVVIPRSIFASYIFLAMLDMLKSLQKTRISSKMFKFNKDLKMVSLMSCEISSSLYSLAYNNTYTITELLKSDFKPNKTLFFTEGLKRRELIFENIVYVLNKSLLSVKKENLPVNNIISVKEYVLDKFN